MLLFTAKWLLWQQQNLRSSRKTCPSFHCYGIILFLQITLKEALFMDDGGHGMVFRALSGRLYLTLHSPNTHLEERPFFHPIDEKGSRLVRQ